MLDNTHLFSYYFLWILIYTAKEFKKQREIFIAFHQFFLFCEKKIFGNSRRERKIYKQEVNND